MEHLTVCLETAKKLEAAGFPQIAKPFYWSNNHDQGGHKLFVKHNQELAASGIVSTKYVEEYAAPTAEGIADQLPPELGVSIYLKGSNFRGTPFDQPRAMFNGDELSMVTRPNMAEALAVLYLKKQGAI